jgi:hypothetical protein
MAKAIAYIHNRTILCTAFADIRIRKGEIQMKYNLSTIKVNGNAVAFKPMRNYDGELTTNIEALMAMAGHGPEAGQWERTQAGLVYQLCSGRRHPSVSPRLAKQVHHEAHLVIQSARQWIHNNLRSFKRHVELTDYEAVQLWKAGRKARIIRVKLGDTILIETSQGSYFGSGGGWGRHVEWGEFTREWVETDDNGFTTHPYYKYTFDQGPAVVYSAAGDGINGGRTFWRRLYVAE